MVECRFSSDQAYPNELDNELPLKVTTAGPYLAGVLGVPEHPQNLGVHKKGKPDFCLSEFSYYYKHPRISKAIYGAANQFFT